MVVGYISSLQVVGLGLLTLATGSHAHEGCMVHSRSREALQQVQAKLENAKRKESLPSSKGRSNSHSYPCQQCIDIETHVVVFHCTDGTSTWVDQAKVNEQMDVLNQGFANTPFKFTLSSTRFVASDVYCRVFSREDEDNPANNVDHSTAIGKEYRQGDYSTLNMYFGGTDSGSFAFFPETGGVEANPYDGAFVAIDTLPGGDSSCCNLGKTATHEVRRNFSNEY